MRLLIKLLTILNSSGESNAAPVISAGDFSGTVPNLTASVSDAESVAYSLGSLAADETVTWTIPSGNEAGKFAIDPDTSEITLAETLNWWNLNFLTGGSTYALTIRATDEGGAYSEVTLTVTVTSPYENGIQFIKGDETAGTDALDYSTVNPGAGTRDGVYNGVTLNQTTNPGGIAAPLADGINDFVNLYSAALNTAFNGQRFTISLWLKAFDPAAFWAGASERYCAAIAVDASNRLFINKGNAANRFRFFYQAGGTNDDIIVDSISYTDWFHVLATYDLTAGASGEGKLYLQGAQVGSTVTSLGTWSGSLSSSGCVLAAFNTSASNPAKVYLSYWRVYNAILPASHVTKLYQEFDA